MKHKIIKALLNNRAVYLDIDYTDSELDIITDYIIDTFEDIQVDFNFDNFLVNDLRELNILNEG